MVLGLSYVSYDQFKRFGESSKDIKLPEIEIPETKLEEFFSPTAEGNKEWVSPNGRLKLTYSAKWTSTDEAFAGSLTQAGIALEETELLFLAYQIDPSLAFLMVNKTAGQKSLEEIGRELEGKIKEQGGESEITILEEENEGGELKIISGYPGQPESYSRGKVIFDQEVIYLVVLSSYQTDWPKFEQEAQKILDSAQLVSVAE